MKFPQTSRKSGALRWLLVAASCIVIAFVAAGCGDDEAKSDDAMKDKNDPAMADKSDDAMEDKTDDAMEDKSDDAMEDKSDDAMEEDG